MKQLTILSLIIFAFLDINAQGSGGIVTGRIISAGNAKSAIPNASVTLISIKDSSESGITAADTSGVFIFQNIKEGGYVVKVSAVGFSIFKTASFNINSGTPKKDLGNVSLNARSNDLTSVEVVAKKQFIEQKIDRMVVNVDAAVSNAGATALEVLEKSPGVTVDKDGNISLKGKQGVQIYIDGRPSYLSGAELVNLLKNMNANQLDQLEIMTNPPAKYDAAGNSGIINIKTKKNKQKGFNGSINAGYSQGAYWRTNESLNLNYRNGKFNAFMNYSFNKNNSFQELTINRVYKNANEETTAVFDQVANMKRSNTNNNLKIGVDYFINQKSTIGIVTSGFLSPENNSNNNTSYLKDADSKVDSIVYSEGTQKNNWKNGAVNLNFRHQYDSTGKELTADLDYSTYASQSRQTFMNANFDPFWDKKGQSDLISNLPVDINIYSAKIDYTLPLKKGLKLETGVKSSFVNTDNSANYFNVVSGVQSVDYDKTNRFSYEENINAAYINVSKQYKKLGVQAGLRFENTNIKGHQFGNEAKPALDSAFERTYNNLFPTVFLSYKLNKINQLGLSVGRRIDRPRYQDLNPFLFFIDNYTYESGNPFLQPQYTNNIELSHTFKSFLTTTLNYSKTTNYFAETFEQVDFATIVRRGNIGERDNIGVSVSAQVPVFKWWTAILYGNYNYNRYQGMLYGENLDVDASMFLFNVNNQFNFKKGWSAELSGFYRSKGLDGQITIGGLGQASAGISKQVLKGKGSVRLNIRDIFYTNKVKGFIDIQGTDARFQNRRDTRVAGISFNYRFGKPIKGPQNNRKKGGAGEEQSRVKGNEQ
ncbi:MAG: TonB-dependent receptor [Chitinophagaceae bacterium]|nr:MAG: TonB-dependent receptor [Chitinophagaceae bacterium]